VLLLGEELAPHASLDEVLRVSHSGRLIEARPKGFSHKVGGSSTVAAFTTMDFL
jgi:hypothetical protein